MTTNKLGSCPYEITVLTTTLLQ